MSVKGLPEWGIQPITLPITFGRHARDISKTFASIDKSKGSKHDYMYGCCSQTFDDRQRDIADVYEDLTLEPTE